MDERNRRKGILTRCLILFGLLGVLGSISFVYCLCDIGGPPDPVVEPITSPLAIGENFDPAQSGTISGQVTWSGATPQVAPFEISRLPPIDRPLPQPLIQDNPNVPTIDAVGQGVGNAVVFLRGIDLKRSRPWDHAAVGLVIDDYRLGVHQGNRAVRHGLVRRGDAVEMVSHQLYCHGLHADGAAFFSLMLPDPDRPSSRRLNQNGKVEFTSAAGCYWMRAYLFVDDHPYYTQTDAQGRFTLLNVPAGRYEIVCWMPNWIERRRERDPESGLITRLVFLPPVERPQPVTVEAGQMTSVDFTLSSADFQ